MNIKAKGDTHIDLHHTTEDTGIVIGEALKASKNCRNKRYAHAIIPMDETLTRVAIDVSNRPYLIWKVKLKLRNWEKWTELFKEWFLAFSGTGALHVKIFTVIILTLFRSCFKGLARSLRTALEINLRKKNQFLLPKVLYKLNEHNNVDYNSGNINLFREVAKGKVNIEVTSI